MRKYILQRMWVDDEGKFDKADGETEQQPLDHVDVDEDEGEIENMARHEASYNFRFENMCVKHSLRLFVFNQLCPCPSYRFLFLQLVL